MLQLLLCRAKPGFYSREVISTKSVRIPAVMATVAKIDLLGKNLGSIHQMYSKFDLQMAILYLTVLSSFLA